MILSTASFVTGLFLGLTQSGIMVLSVLIYPSAVRSTGVGCTMGVGRLGSALSPLLVGMLVAFHLSAVQIFVVLGVVLLLAVPCGWAIVVYGRRNAAAPARFGGPLSQAAQAETS